MPASLRPLADDTSLAAETFQFERFARMEVHEKLAILQGLNRLGDGMALVGIRERYPHASQEEQRARLFALKHGRELSIKVFGWDPETEGW